MRLWTRWRCAVILATLFGCLASTTAAEPPTLSQEVEGLLHVVSLTGHEEPAVRYIRQRLDGLPVVEDTLPCATSTATLYRDVSPSPGSSRKRLAWLAHGLSPLPCQT